MAYVRPIKKCSRCKAPAVYEIIGATNEKRGFSCADCCNDQLNSLRTVEREASRIAMRDSKIALATSLIDPRELSEEEAEDVLRIFYDGQKHDEAR